MCALGGWWAGGAGVAAAWAFFVHGGAGARTRGHGATATGSQCGGAVVMRVGRRAARWACRCPSCAAVSTLRLRVTDVRASSCIYTIVDAPWLYIVRWPALSMAATSGNVTDVSYTCSCTRVRNMLLTCHKPTDTPVDTVVPLFTVADNVNCW